MLVIVFTVLLTLAGAQEDLAEAQTDLKKSVAAVEPARRTHLVAIGRLEAKEKAALARISRLENQITGYEAVKRLIDKARAQGRDLISDVQLLWTFEPVIKRLKRVLGAPQNQDSKSLLANAAQTLDTQRRLIASLQSSKSDSEVQSLYKIANLETDLAQRERALASQGRDVRSQIAALAKENRNLADAIQELKKKSSTPGKKAGRGGKDYPSCWRDNRDRVVAVFNIQILDNGYIVNKAWPREFQTQATGTKAIMALLTARSQKGFLGIEDFKRLAGRIKTYSDLETPAKKRCVYYANTKGQTSTPKIYIQNKKTVDRYFYPNRTE